MKCRYNFGYRAERIGNTDNWKVAYLESYGFDVELTENVNFPPKIFSSLKGAKISGTVYMKKMQQAELERTK